MAPSDQRHRDPLQRLDTGAMVLRGEGCARSRVVEIHDFLFEILELFETHYGVQIHRFYEHYSQKNMDQPKPRLPADDPPF